MKRKLSDLKENECIKVNTLRDAKYFCYKGNWIMDRPNPKEIKGEFIVFVEPNIIAWNRIDGLSKKELRNVLPASDFIKPKKSKLKKVWQEIARMDGRIADLEDRNKNPNTGLPVPSECETKELNELPDKWCVKDNEIVSKWAADRFGCNEVTLEYDVYLHVGHCDKFRDYIFKHKIIKGFTIISQSDFERLVLNKPKEIIQEKEIDWSVAGQIVQGEYTTAITTGNHENSLFEGFVVKVTDGSKVNHLCKTLIKKYFHLSKEETILKNE